jgi:electron transfer flavoprotein alpha subunit
MTGMRDMQGIGRAMMALSSGVLAMAVFGAGALAQTTPAPAPTDESAIKPVVEKTCSSCHVFSQVSAQRKTAEQWATIVDQMISFGAPISDEEYPKVVDYLAKTYGAETGGTKPAGR